MKIAVIIIRVLMGLMFLNASIGYFFDLYPAPAEVTESPTTTYITGISVVYMLPIVKTIELICALSFLAGRYVALFLVVLFPITINIVLLHAITDLATAGIAIGIFIAHVFLLFAYRKHYSGMFVARRIE